MLRLAPLVLLSFHGGAEALSQAAAANPTCAHAGSRVAMSRLAQAARQPAPRVGEVVCLAAESGQAVAAQQQPPPPQKESKNKKKETASVHGQPFVVGLSHKTATVEVREKLSIQEPMWNEASAKLCEYESIQEAAVLSTCNRFEVYLVAEDHFAATRDTMAFLREHSGLEDSELRPNLFVLQNEDATWHLLRVAAGLDSLVVGEGQILSQVKACYTHAIEPATEDTPIGGSGGKVLGRLLNSAVMAGKFIRSETEIAKGAVSISSAAVELAMIKAISDLKTPLDQLRVTIVGAGKMSKLLLTHLASHGVTKVTLLNRSRPSAEELAAGYPDVDIDIRLMDEFWSSLEESDIAFTSTSATNCIVTKDELMAGPWESGDKPLMLVDISVPRNVEASCNDVPGVFAYNVDDLKQVVAANQAKRRHKVLEAELLLRVELAKFVQWQESLRYVPSIAKLQKKFDAIRQAGLAKAHKKGLKGLSDKEREAVDVATKGIINKLLHGPMSYLRSDDHDGTKATVQQIEQMFMLDKEQR
jgi:glutamyl-tRNA reductase